MNKKQFDKICEKLKVNEFNRAACYLVFFGGFKYYQAEVKTFGKATGTLSRICKRIEKEYKFSLELFGNRGISSIPNVGDELYLKVVGFDKLIRADVRKVVNGIILFNGFNTGVDFDLYLKGESQVLAMYEVK